MSQICYSKTLACYALKMGKLLCGKWFLGQQMGCLDELYAASKSVCEKGIALERMRWRLWGKQRMWNVKSTCEWRIVDWKLANDLMHISNLKKALDLVIIMDMCWGENVACLEKGARLRCWWAKKKSEKCEHLVKREKKIVCYSWITKRWSFLSIYICMYVYMYVATKSSWIKPIMFMGILPHRQLVSFFLTCFELFLVYLLILRR